MGHAPGARAIVVMTTFDNRTSADQLADLLIEQRLAACVQILGPMTSVYRWQEKVERSEEFLMLIKTRLEHYEALETTLAKHHPYDEPEILAVPAQAVSSGYLAWLLKETAHGGTP